MLGVGVARLLPAERGAPREAFRESTTSRSYEGRKHPAHHRPTTFDHSRTFVLQMDPVHAAEQTCLEVPTMSENDRFIERLLLAKGLRR